MAHNQGSYNQLFTYGPFDPTASTVKKIKVVIDHNRIDETLTDFPQTLYLGTSSGITGVDTSEIFNDLAGFPNNKKIAVGTLDGTQYPVEISYWNTWERKAILHVKIPLISNLEDTVFYLFWDRTQDSNVEYVSITGEKTFDESFSDTFHNKTDQIFRRLDGNVDYGWNLLNGNAVDKIDVNTTNPGKLIIDLDDTNTDWYDGTATGPYVYKWLTGDFDFEIKVNHNADANTEAVALQVRDPEASAGEDWIQILTGYDSAKGNAHWEAINTTNDSSSETNGAGDYSYLRIRREGSSFTVYNKAYTSDDWTQRGSYTRSDIGELVQLGIVAYTGNTSNNFEVSVDYFKVLSRDLHSDIFDEDTEFTFASQYDGKHEHGWWSLNIANTDVIDINDSNADQLTIDCDATASDWYDDIATGPFVYKKIKGDFDVETHIDHNANQNYETARILVRDPNASAGEDWISLDAHFEASTEGVAAITTTDDVSARSDFVLTDKYLRIRRDGETFRLYSKATAGASWSLRSTYTRKDFHDELEVGLSASPVNTGDDYVAKFDYFNIYTKAQESDDFADLLTTSFDEFGSLTEQNFLTGGDGEKSHGWNLLNSSSADTLDTNITNAGSLTFDSDATDTIWWDASATSPYLYKYISGDFDVETYISATNQNQNYEQIRFMVRDPDAGSGEDWLSIGYGYDGGNKIETIDTDSSSSDSRVKVSSTDRYLRITRQGNTFTLYSKASEGAAWTERDVITRQFNYYVQIGLVFRTGNTTDTFTAQIDYFRVDQDIDGTTQVIQYGDGDFLFGWKGLNVKNLTALDVGRSNYNRLTFNASTKDTRITDAAFSGPFVYKEITGNFDVETHVEHDADANYEYAYLLIRDPKDDSTDSENWIAAVSGYNAGAKHFSVTTVNDSSTWTSVSDAWEYLRIKRVDDVFQVFAKENVDDSWTLLNTYYRYDFPETVQVGLAQETYNTSGAFVAQFHYFNIKINEATPGELVWSNGYERVYHMHEIPEVDVEGILDSTAKRAHGIAKGTLDSTNVEKDVTGNHGIEFDQGDSDYISFPTLKPNDFSIEVVTRLDSRSGSFQHFVGFTDSANTSRRGIILDTANEHVSVLYTNNTNGYWRDGTAPNGLVLSETNYLALTYDQITNTPKAYINHINGVLGSEQSLSNAEADVGYIGRDNASDAAVYLDGMISEVRISSVERSQAWIKASNYSLKDILVYFGDPEFDPEDSGDFWERILNIEVDTAKVDEDLIDFPVLLKLDTSAGIDNANLTNFFVYLENNSNRYKINLVSDNLYHQIPIEIDHWDNSGKEAILYARIPFISSLADSTSGTRLRLYYDLNHSDNRDYVGDTDQFSTFSSSIFSDEFSSTTYQNLIDANGDGEKHYGWNILNSSIVADAEVKSGDSKLKIIASTTATDWNDGTATGCFIFKELIGDFDIEVDFSTTRGNDNDGHGLMVRDPDASAGEDWLYIAEFGANAWRTRNTTNDVSVETDGTDVVFSDLRIKREGNNFYLYNRPDDSYDDWTLRATYTRTDFADTVQIGIFTVTNSTSGAHVVNAEYFRVKHKPAQRVWEDFKAVFHMSQNPASSDIFDSSPGRRHGTVNGNITADDWVNAQLYKGIDFDYDTNEYIDFGSDVLIESDKPFSIIGYSNVDNCEIDRYQTPITIKTDTTEGFLVAFSDNTSYNGLTAGSGSATYANFNTQNLSGSADFEDQYVVWTVTFDGVDADDNESYGITVDGNNETLEASGTYTSSSNVNQIGRDSDFSTRTFDGIIDELWVGKTYHTVAWRKATYHSLTDDLLIYLIEFIPPIEEDIFVAIESDIFDYDFQSTSSDSVFVGIEAEIFQRDLGDLGWANRLEIKISRYLIPETLTDFPLTIHLDACSGINNQDVTHIFDELGGDSTEGRFKIAVTSGDGLTQLYVEIEKWDLDNKKAVLHVKIPTLTANIDNYLYFYYDQSQPDNTTYIGETGDTPAQNVWNSNFVAVYHMHTDPSSGSGSVLDSTSNGFDGGPYNTSFSPELVDGVVGDALLFDGGNSTGLIFNDPNIGWGNECDGASAITLEAFFKKTGIGSSKAIVCSQISNNAFGFEIGQSNSTTFEMRGSSVSGESASISTATISFNQWHYAGALFDFSNDNNSCVIDDTEVIDESKTYNNSTYTLATPSYLESIGNYFTTAPNWEWDGLIDEVRVSKVERSVAWRKTTSLSLHDNLYTFTEVVANTTLSTCPFGWEYWRTVNIESPEKTNELVVKVVLDNSDSSIDFDFDLAAKDGRDIRFLSNSGLDTLDYWREYYQGVFDGNDLFNDAVIDDVIWTIHPSTNGVIEIASFGGLLIGYDATPSSELSYIQSRYELNGDFDIQIDYSDLDTESVNSNGIELRVGELGVQTAGDDSQLRDEAYIRAGYQSGNVFESDHRNDGTWQGSQTTSRINNIGQLRIVRSGSNLTFYYNDDDTGGWVNWRTVSFHDRDVVVRLAYNGAGGTSPSAIIDDFTVNSGSPEKTEYAIFWVKVPCLNIGDNTFFMVYGNSDAIDVSDSSIFTFFDDFSIGSTIDTIDKWAATDGVGSGGTWEQANSIVRNATLSGFGGLRSTENGTLFTYSPPLRYRAHIKVTDNTSNASVVWGNGNINSTHGVWVRPGDLYQLFGVSGQTIISNDDDWHIIEAQWFSGTPDDEDGIVDDNLATAKTHTNFDDSPASIELWKNKAYLNVRWAFFTPMLASGDPTITLGNNQECAKLLETGFAFADAEAFQEDTLFEFFEEDVSVEIDSDIFQDDTLIQAFEDDVDVAIESGIFQTDGLVFGEFTFADIESGFFQTDELLEPFPEPVLVDIESTIFSTDVYTLKDDILIDVEVGLFQDDTLIVPIEEEVLAYAEIELFITEKYVIGDEYVLVDIEAEAFETDSLIEPFEEEHAVFVESDIFSFDAILYEEDLLVDIESDIFEDDVLLFPFQEEPLVDVEFGIFQTETHTKPEALIVDIESFIPDVDEELLVPFPEEPFVDVEGQAFSSHIYVFSEDVEAEGEGFAPDIIETLLEPFQEPVDIEIDSGTFQYDLWVKYFDFILEDVPADIFIDDLLLGPVEEDLDISIEWITTVDDIYVVFEEFERDVTGEITSFSTEDVIFPFLDTVTATGESEAFNIHYLVRYKEELLVDCISEIIIDDDLLTPEPEELTIDVESDTTLVFDTLVKYKEFVEILDDGVSVFIDEELITPYTDTVTAVARVETFPYEAFVLFFEDIGIIPVSEIFITEVFTEPYVEDIAVITEPQVISEDYQLVGEEFLDVESDCKTYITEDYLQPFLEELLVSVESDHFLPFQPKVVAADFPLIDIESIIFIQDDLIQPFVEPLIGIDKEYNIHLFDTWVRYKEDVVVLVEGYHNAFSVNRYDHVVVATGETEIIVDGIIPIQIENQLNAKGEYVTFYQDQIDDYSDDVLVSIEVLTDFDSLRRPFEHVTGWEVSALVDDVYLPQCPDEYNFRKVQVGDSEVAAISFHNDTGIDYVVNKVKFKGDNPEEFNYIGPTSGFTLISGFTYEFLVEFTPSSYGVKSAVLVINENDIGITILGCALTPLYDFPEDLEPPVEPLDTVVEIEAEQSTYEIPKRRKPIIIR